MVCLLLGVLSPVFLYKPEVWLKDFFRFRLSVFGKSTQRCYVLLIVSQQDAYSIINGIVIIVLLLVMLRTISDFRK